MNLFKLFQSKSLAFYSYLGVISVLSSVTNLGIIIMVNKTISNKQDDIFGAYSLSVFIVLIILSFLISAIVRRNIAALTNDNVFKLEISMIQKIRQASFESFNKTGKENIYASLGDIQVIGQAPVIIINIINAGIAFVLPFCYLFWISMTGGIVMFMFIALLIVIYQYFKQQTIISKNKVRDYQNRYYAYLNDLLNGFKQVKVSTVRNNTLFDDFIYSNGMLQKN